MKNGFDAKMSKVGTHCCCDMSEKGLWVLQLQQTTDSCSLWPLNVMKVFAL
jgi:hypothetical protein